jgi:hypothetical protein
MSESDWQAVLLELLNTTPVIDGQVVDLLDRAWLRVHGATGGVDDVRRLRDDLQHVVWGEADASVLRRYLGSVRQVPRIHDGRLAWDLDADWSARVVLTWGELQNAMPDRLRACANEECRLFLIDRSRAGTARWCSMSGCGNRMKARRHYRRSAREG